MAAGDVRKRIAHAGTTLDAAGRHRLAHAGAHARTVACSVINCATT
eukprot:gene2113-3007_t